MQDFIKRYFWSLGVVAALVCAGFAARATNYVVEAKYLRDADHAPKLPPVVVTPAAVHKPTNAKDGRPLVARDMFCSDCTPPADVAMDLGSGSNVDASSVQPTNLPLVLLATNVGNTEGDSYATIVNTDSQHQGAFAIGDPMPGATGKITEIHYKYVDFENQNHIERLSLLGAPPQVAQAAAPVPSGNGDDQTAMLDAGIKKIDDNHYEISKDLVDKVLLNPMGFTKGARINPAMDGGKPNGFKLFGIRHNSMLSKLGLENGDTLISINGMELTSAEQALQVYTKLRDATTLEINLTRRTKPDTLTYQIR